MLCRDQSFGLKPLEGHICCAKSVNGQRWQRPYRKNPIAE